MRELNRIILLLTVFVMVVSCSASLANAAGSKKSKITISNSNKTTVKKFVKLAGKSDSITVTVKTKYKTKKAVKANSLKLLKKLIKSAGKKNSKYKYSYKYKSVKKKNAVYTVKVKKVTKTTDKKTEDPSDTSDPSKDKTNVSKYDISKIIERVELHEVLYGFYVPYPQKQIGYRGEALTPSVDVIFKDGFEFSWRSMKKMGDIYYDSHDNPYTLKYSFSNNINVGTATITIVGSDGFTGTYKTTFEIIKKQHYFNLESYNMNLDTSETAQIKISDALGKVTFVSRDENVCKVDKNGTITPIAYGRTYVTVSEEGDANHIPYTCDVAIDVYNSDIVIPDPKDVFYNELQVDRNDDGTVRFMNHLNYGIKPEKALALIKQGRLKISAVDVTPKALKKALTDVGIPYEDPGVKIVDESTLKYEVAYGVCNRMVKIVEEYDGHLLSAFYLFTPKSSARDYEIFATVRKKVEAKLWTDDMTNYEKIKAIADYINYTTHYDTMEKEANPELWANFSIDDRMYYNEAGLTKCDAAMRCIMQLQGGFAQCTVVDSISRYFAQEDLGLKYVYNNGTFMAGEGVYIGVGTESSALSPGSHTTLFYRDASYTADQKYGYAIDSQGLMDMHGSCSEAGCRTHLIDLSE